MKAFLRYSESNSGKNRWAIAFGTVAASLRPQPLRFAPGLRGVASTIAGALFMFAFIFLFVFALPALFGGL